MAALLFLSTVATISVAEDGAAETAVDLEVDNIALCQDSSARFLVEPGASVNQIFIEANLPAGLTVSDISHGGVHDEDNDRVKFAVDAQMISQDGPPRFMLGELPVGDGPVEITGEWVDDRSNGGSFAASFHLVCPATQVERELPLFGECGESTTVVLSIDWTRANGAWVEETVPQGWVISGPSNGGVVQSGGTVRWSLDPSIAEVSYQVSVPSAAQGPHAFTGEYVDDTMSQSTVQAPVQGDNLLDLVCGTSVIRSGLDDQQCGDTFTHGLDLDWAGAGKLFIEETYPAGWTASNPSHAGVLQSDNTVKWLLEDDSVETVRVDIEIPASAEGSFPFSGGFITDSGGSSKGIVGEHTMVVSCGDPPDNGDSGPGDGGSGTLRDTTVQRDSSFSTIHPGQSGMVKLNVNLRDASIAEIRETLPGAGFSATGISHGGFLAGGTIQWDLADPTVDSLSYQLGVVDTANLAIFGVWTYSGNVMDDIKSSPTTITGDGSLLVVHRYDSNQNCMFSDDGLFMLVDDWKAQQATDNELFSGTDAWKQLPGTYC